MVSLLPIVSSVLLLGRVSQVLIVSLVLLFRGCHWCLRSPYCNGFAALDASVTGAAGVSGVALALCTTAACVSWVLLVSRVPL